MTRADWEFYAILRRIKGKRAANAFKSYKNKKKRKYGLGEIEDPFRICIDMGMDGYIKKRLYSANLTDEDKADIENDICISRRYSAYDCTGEAFTSWISFFHVPGGTWCYHCVSFDV